LRRRREVLYFCIKSSEVWGRGREGGGVIYTLTATEDLGGEGVGMDNFGVMSVGVRIRNPR
jgi:hypothetical protein